MLEPPLLITFGVAQVLGLLAVVFVVMGATKDPGTTNFVWHPVLMSIGLVYLFGCAAVIYRVLRFMEKLHAKIVHAGIHMAALIFSLAGIVLAIQLKNTYGLEHFTTLHGIFGLLTFITFTAQWIISIPVFLYPKAPDHIRAPGLSVHVCVGIAVFLCAAITTFTGLNNKSTVTSTGPDEGQVYFRTSAFFYLFYVLVIFYMVTLKEYKRPPDN